VSKETKAQQRFRKAFDIRRDGLIIDRNGVGWDYWGKRQIASWGLLPARGSGECCNPGRL